MKKLILILWVMFLFSGITSAQVKSSIAVKDLNSGIEKYIKKNFEGFKTTEAFKYEVCYEIVILKDGKQEDLVFDTKGKFIAKRTEDIVPVRTRTTISLKDLNSDIQKYVKKNFEGYKITEAYLYDLAYSAKIVKGDVAETLLFDKNGKFEKKLVAAPAAVKEQPKKTDSVPANKAKEEEPKKADTTKK